MVKLFIQKVIHALKKKSVPTQHPKKEAHKAKHAPAAKTKHGHKAETKQSPSHTPPARRHPPKPVEGKKRFHDFDLPDEIMRAIDDLEFEYCTPIQAGVLPHTLEGKDAFGQAQTGTGKTAAFLIAIFSRLLKQEAHTKTIGSPRALVLAPTRELAMQIHKDALDLSKYLPLTTISLFGGMDYDKQRQQLKKPVDIVIATPGRLIDFMGQRTLHLNKVRVLVIDEADRMLDMGFIPDVRRIISNLPAKNHRQTVLFSATLNQDIQKLASNWTVDPVTIEIEPDKKTVDTVNQVFYIVARQEKFALLYNMLKNEALERTIVFCNRREEAEQLANQLKRCGIHCEALSGALPQQKRMRVLEGFRKGDPRLLVATDVAARGLHVEEISHVINYNLPMDPENYVHRIGRTGRAGSLGISVSFADEFDGQMIPQLEKFIGRSLICTHPPEEWFTLPASLNNVAISEIAAKRHPPMRPRRGGFNKGSRRPSR